MLDAARASRFARLTLKNIGREYPYKLDLVLNGPEDAVPPSALHPIFHGSFDWHSCIHGWWQLMRLARRFPDLPEAALIHARADAMLVPDKVAGELAYLARPNAGGFERPYGWAWLLALHGELVRADRPHWAEALAPLATAFSERFKAYLPKLTYVIRNGSHSNTAFALILAHEWAEAHDAELARLIARRASDWFLNDRATQAWEPGGDDFLSPSLCEAVLMQRVQSHVAFKSWFSSFLPALDEREPATLFTPVTVSDRSDGKIVHLDGLNLSRAWCWRLLGFEEVADLHLAVSLPYIAVDYAGEHWLATFALLALERG